MLLFLAVASTLIVTNLPFFAVRIPHGVYMLLFREVLPYVNLESLCLAGVSLRFELFKVSQGFAPIGVS